MIGSVIIKVGIISTNGDDCYVIETTKGTFVFESGSSNGFGVVCGIVPLSDYMKEYKNSTIIWSVKI